MIVFLTQAKGCEETHVALQKFTVGMHVQQGETSGKDVNLLVYLRTIYPCKVTVVAAYTYLECRHCEQTRVSTTGPDTVW